MYLDFSAYSVPFIRCPNELDVSSAVDRLNCIRCFSSAEFAHLSSRMYDFVAPQMSFKSIVRMVLEVLDVARHGLRSLLVC